MQWKRKVYLLIIHKALTNTQNFYQTFGSLQRKSAVYPMFTERLASLGGRKANIKEPMWGDIFIFREAQHWKLNVWAYREKQWWNWVKKETALHGVSQRTDAYAREESLLSRQDLGSVGGVNRPIKDACGAGWAHHTNNYSKLTGEIYWVFTARLPALTNLILWTISGIGVAVLTPNFQVSGTELWGFWTNWCIVSESLSWCCVQGCLEQEERKGEDRGRAPPDCMDALEDLTQTCYQARRVSTDLPTENRGQGRPPLSAISKANPDVLERTPWETDGSEDAHGKAWKRGQCHRDHQLLAHYTSQTGVCKRTGNRVGNSSEGKGKRLNTANNYGGLTAPLPHTRHCATPWEYPTE